MLNINFKNLGSISEGNIKLNKLTLICGENNSGKTYLNYMLYELLDKRFTLRHPIFHDIFDLAKESGIYKLDLKDFLDNSYIKLKLGFEKKFQTSLDRFFSATQGTFKNFRLDIVEDLDMIKNSIF
ncbi:MAG: AAA family ATPase, partial [Sulfurimonas sp.]|nr:AAA family ATPase [Sulfurimonas sp.]